MVPSAEKEMLRLQSTKLLAVLVARGVEALGEGRDDALRGDPEDPAAEVRAAGGVAVGGDRDDVAGGVGGHADRARSLDRDVDRRGGQRCLRGDRARSGRCARSATNRLPAEVGTALVVVVPVEVVVRGEVVIPCEK